MTSAAPRMELRHQDFTVDLPQEPLYLHADRGRLTQVLTNLLDNAAKYTPEGGAIRLTVTLSDGVIQCSVKDTGIGIPNERLRDIFELFAQLKEPGAQTDGLGLGLALVAQIVSLHGGSIQASSEGPGKGSEFIVRLPTGATR